MRVEKKIGDRAKAEGKKSDAEAREFANDVFDVLSQMAEHEPAEGQAVTEAERLASVLCFFRTMTIEYLRQVRNYPDTQDAERERIRVAHEAFIMLRDVARARRHPVHKFFSGSAQRLKSRQPSSREMARDCILIAATKALVDAGAQQEMKAAAAIRLLKSRPGIGEHMPTEEAFVKVLSRKEIDPEYVDDIVDYREMLNWSNDGSTDGILAWTEMALSFREQPLDRRAATTIKHLALVRHTPDGGAVLMRPRPAPLVSLPGRNPALAKPAPKRPSA